jgi:hypothetical protein
MSAEGGAISNRKVVLGDFGTTREDFGIVSLMSSNEPSRGAAWAELMNRARSRISAEMRIFIAAGFLS